jgi:hypothetical protein
MQKPPEHPVEASADTVIVSDKSSLPTIPSLCMAARTILAATFL